MTKFEKIYSSMSSAKRGAVRAKLSAPVFTKRSDGKVVLTEQRNKTTRVLKSTVDSPVAEFRTIFSEKYGKVARKEIIQAAISRGVAKNTAATYYQKLAAEFK